MERAGYLYSVNVECGNILPAWKSTVQTHYEHGTITTLHV